MKHRTHVLVPICLCLAGIVMPARAEIVQATADVEAVAITGSDSIDIQVRWIVPTDGQPAGSTRFVSVREARFGPDGVDRIQKLAVSALLARNRIFFLFDDTNDQVTAIRLMK